MTDVKLALDTNAYCLCDIGDERALSQLDRAERLYLPTVTYGELYYGFKHGRRFGQNVARLDRFIDEFAVVVVHVDQEVAKCYGVICASLRKKGRPIPTNDIWIAASTMHVGATLLTSDSHFQDVDEIRTEWLQEPEVSLGTVP